MGTDFHGEDEMPVAGGYDEAALERFIEEGRKAWADVPDAAQWVRNLRDGGLGEENERLRGKLESARVALQAIVGKSDPTREGDEIWELAMEGLKASE